MIYYIADMHFGHTNVLRFDNRPFPDTAQMDDTLIQNWNGRVTSDDTVYVLGDAFWKNEENSIRIMERLQGQKQCDWILPSLYSDRSYRFKFIAATSPMILSKFIELALP